MKSAGRRLRGHNFNAVARAGIVLRRICPQSPEVDPPVSRYYRCPEKNSVIARIPIGRETR